MVLILLFYFICFDIFYQLAEFYPRDDPLKRGPKNNHIYDEVE